MKIEMQILDPRIDTDELRPKYATAGSCALDLRACRLETKPMTAKINLYPGGKVKVGAGFSIHMPRWASRILLEVTAIRVERLQDISEADAQAEGAYADAACNGMFTTDGNTYTTKQDGAAGAYAELWERLHGDDAWAANPWVWVVEFKKLGAGETAGVTP